MLSTSVTNICFDHSHHFSHVLDRGAGEDPHSALAEARRFDRVGSLCPCIFLFILLVFLVVNLTDSTAATLTGAEVSIAVGMLAFYAFVVVPMILCFKRGEPMKCLALCFAILKYNSGRF